MQCKDVREILSPYLDGFLEPEEQRKVERHLESCPACQAQYADLRHTVELLRELPEVTPPAGFRKQLREQLEALEQPVPVATGSARSKGRGGWRNWMGMLAAAAVLVVALGISGLWQGSLANLTGPGEGLLARLFTGSGQSDKLALEEQVQAGQKGHLEKLVDRLALDGSAPALDVVPESMDIATVPEGRGGDDYARVPADDDQTMIGITAVGTGEESMMGAANEPPEVGSSAKQLAREAHLTLIVSEPVQVAAEIADLGQMHNARVTASTREGNVVLELRVALDDFKPFWQQLQSYGKISDRIIKDHDLSRDIESAEVNIQQLLGQQKELSQPVELEQIKHDLLTQQRQLDELNEQAGTAVIKLKLNREE